MLNKSATLRGGIFSMFVVSDQVLENACQLRRVTRLKKPAGSAIVYPTTVLHRVEPVTRGARIASFFWIQSMVRDDSARRMLFELDQAVQRLAGQLGQGDRSVVELTGVYHNLLRRWADA